MDSHEKHALVVAIRVNRNCHAKGIRMPRLTQTLVEKLSKLNANEIVELMEMVESNSRSV